MGTVPTGRMERELRALYLRWLAGVPRHQDDMPAYISKFQKDSTALIAKLGGQAASLGALADFPVPKMLELSPVVGVVYEEMHQAAIKAGIAAGLQSKDVARQMLNAGLDKSYRRLERLARTETTSAYWKNSWDSIADLPEIVMVWGSEESKRTCDYCLSREGLVVEDPNIRDHPNGRCTLIPTLRSQVKYKGTLQPDGSVVMDPRWADQKVKGAKAQASAGPTTPEQRDPLSGKGNPAAPSVAQPVHQSISRPDDSMVPKPVLGQATSFWSKKKTPKYVISDLAEQTSKLNTDYLDALDAYTNNGAFSPVNAELRGVARKDSMMDDFFDLGDDSAGYIGQLIDDLDAAIDKQRTMTEMTLYRGVESGSLSDLKRGTVITDKGYMSTTVNPTVAEEIANGGDVLRISYPYNRPALYVDALPDINLNQSEVLLPRGLTMKVTSIQQVNGMRVINVAIQ